MKLITDTMHKIGGGLFIDQATDKMAELVRSVNETGRSGKLTLTITAKKMTRSGAIHIAGEPKLTLPKKEPLETVLFSTEDGELTEDHPNQQKLDLKAVPEAEADQLKTINEDK